MFSRDKPRPTTTIYADDPPADPQRPHKWPTKRQRAASRKSFDARLEAEKREAAELAEQFLLTGRCEHGPRIVSCESWAWSRAEHRLLSETTVARCWHGVRGFRCPHYHQDDGMPSCRLLHATDRELLPPWARSDKLSDEEWTEKLTKWTEENNERETANRAAATGHDANESEAADFSHAQS